MTKENWYTLNVKLSAAEGTGTFIVSLNFEEQFTSLLKEAFEMPFLYSSRIRNLETVTYILSLNNEQMEFAIEMFDKLKDLFNGIPVQDCNSN